MAARRRGRVAWERSVLALAMALALVVPPLARTPFAAADDPHCPQGCGCRWLRTGEFTADCALRGLTTLPHLSHHVQSLSAAGNVFRKLEQDFLGSGATHPRLRSLDLSNCSISHVHLDAFKPVPNLWTLNLTHNQLQKLDPYTFTRTPHLWQLALRGNALDVSETPLLHAPDLSRLDLSANRLDALPADAFSGTPKLVSLNLADNGLRRVDPNWFRPLHQLKLLQLQNNSLTTMGTDTFVRAPQLFELNLSNNFLVLPAGRPFLRVPNLEKLYLNACGLGALPPDAFDLAPSIRILWLARNRLRHLHLQQLQDLQALYYFNACGNELLCDCALRDVHSWAAYQGVRADVTCNMDAKEAWARDDASPGADECDASWDILDQIDCNATEAAPTAAASEAEESLSTIAGYAALGVALLLGLLIVVVGTLYWVRTRARPNAAPHRGSCQPSNAIPLIEDPDA